MFLIKAIPIARGVGRDMLSYWSPKEAPVGSIVRVPLRKKIVGALVVEIESVSESKSEIKSADFTIKKIANPRARMIISQNFFKAVEETSKYFAATIGSTLFESVPAAILNEYEKVPEAKVFAKRSKPRESYALQKNEDDRYGHYKSLIRERFARTESVFMMMPSVEDIKKACSYFEKGIEKYTFTFHSGLAKGEILKRWKAALNTDHPIVIVATGTFLSLPRNDIGLFIVEHENARGYKIQSRPFIDYRFLAEKYAREIGADLIFGDSCLRVETIWREDRNALDILGTDALVEYAPLSMRSLSTARDTLIDMKKYKKSSRLGSDDIRILSDELIALAQKTRQENGNLFIFAGRKGLSPQTVCSDCETAVTCDRCSAPLVLHGKDEQRFFLCNRCGRKRDAHIKCANCGGWRLKTLGIGSERVEAELKAALPESKVFRLDRNSASTHKRALDIIDKWYASPGSILVGTEMALLYLDKMIDYCAVGSLDALFSIPDFRINEKIFSIIVKLRSIARKEFLLQTRNPDMPVLMQGVKGNIIDFYREEIEAREKFSFPPFSLFIKISYSGKKDDVLEAMDNLKKELFGWQIDVFPAFIATIRNQYMMHALVKLPRKDWPQQKLLEKLRGLSPAYAINVDPESIL